MEENYQDYIDELNKNIREAETSRDAFRYFQLCNEAGLEPSDKYLYEQGQADALFNKGLEKIVSSSGKKFQPKKRKGHKTGISVALNSTDAKTVYNNFSFRENYLRELIQKYVPENTRKPVDEMSYKELRHYGYVIRGVAKKELKKY